MLVYQFAPFETRGRPRRGELDEGNLQPGRGPEAVARPAILGGGAVGFPQALRLELLRGEVRPHFTEEQFQPDCLWEPHCPPGQGCGACFRFRPTPRLQISLIEFATQRAASCSKRGKLVDRQFLVQSFFENIMHNSETLMEGIAGRP